METQEYAEGSGLYTILETFLRGMETPQGWTRTPRFWSLETFLRGMETGRELYGRGDVQRPLKPSLEGWKQRHSRRRASSAPPLETFLRGMETRRIRKH